MRARKIRNKHRESRTVAKIEMRVKIKGYRKRKINDEIFKIRTDGTLLSQFLRLMEKRAPFAQKRDQKSRLRTTDPKCELEG